MDFMSFNKDHCPNIKCTAMETVSLVKGQEDKIRLSDPRSIF